MNRRRRASDKRKLLVLIVDDDASMRLLMRASLEKEDMHVEEAADGEAALVFLENIMPDVILLDVQMPMMDGFTVCQKIRSLPNGVDVPILMITGLDDTESIQRAYDAGATDFVIKPINWIILNYRLRYIARAGQARMALRDSELHLALAQKVARMGNWKWNITDDTVYCSEQIFSILGQPSHEAIIPYASFMDYVHVRDKKNVALAVDEALNKKKEFSIDHRLTTDRGEIFVHNQAEVQFDDSSSKPLFMFGTMQDITVRKQLEQRMQYLAYYDELTGLANRQLFKEQFDLEIRHAQREETLLALCYLDLDHFKKINDSLGHDAGDYVLKVVAKRLKQCLRSSDSIARLTKKEGDVEPLHETATLSRMGGDEFTLLLPGLREAEQAALVAQRIIREVAKPIEISGTDYYVTASIGIAICPEDGTDMDSLLKNADVAMYTSKRDGKNAYTFYSNSLNTRAVERFSMQNELRQALENSQLILHYQPVIAVSTDKVKGFEALIRWQHPSLGLLPPDRFIRLAEECGQINAIGEWVLNTACAHILEWQEHAAEPLRISVNFSAMQLKQKDLLVMIERVLKKTGIPPRLLDLDLTESAIMADVEKTVIILNELKKLGINLSIDNFGTGYSSLSYLKKLPIDVIKIDRSFIQEVETSEDNAAIVRAVVGLAKTMGMAVVAEGVEHEDQLDFIRSSGCDDVQGFLLGRPMPSDEVVPFLWKQA